MAYIPKLPPKAGYVEIEEEGVPVYKRVAAPDEVEIKETALDNMSMIVDHEYRLTLMEVGVK